MDKSEKDKYVSTTKEYRYMCPGCFSYVKKPCAEHPTDPNEDDIAEKSMPSKCPKCGYEKLFVVDAGICDAIQTLNRKGYFTSFCCEGHIHSNHGMTCPYISFKPGVWKSVGDMKLPSSWYGEVRHQYKGDRATRKTLIAIYANHIMDISTDEELFEKFDSIKEKALKDIKSWANNLPRKTGLAEKILSFHKKK